MNIPPRDIQNFIIMWPYGACSLYRYATAVLILNPRDQNICFSPSLVLVKLIGCKGKKQCDLAMLKAFYHHQSNKPLAETAIAGVKQKQCARMYNER